MKPSRGRDVAARRRSNGICTARPIERSKPAESLPIGADLTFAGETMVHLGHTASGMLVLMPRSEFGRFGPRITLIRVDPLTLATAGTDAKPEGRS